MKTLINTTLSLTLTLIFTFSGTSYGQLGLQGSPQEQANQIINAMAHIMPVPSDYKRNPKLKWVLANYNIGMLDGYFASVAGKKQRFKYVEQELGSYIDTLSPEVFYIQELWYKKDREIVQNMFEAKGYESVSRLIKQRKIIAPAGTATGLEIFIKKEIVDSGDNVEVGFTRYTTDDGHRIRATFEMLGGIERGLIWARFKSQGKEMLVATTHLTPLYNEFETRSAQVGVISKILKKHKGIDHIALGVDFNISPSFEFQVQNRDKEGSEEEWTKNIENYVKFVVGSGLVDTVASSTFPIPYTQDRLNNDLTNSLRNSSTATEPEQRLDYIWVGAQNKASAVEVFSTRLIFDKPIKDAKSGQIVLSKDYGPQDEPNAKRGGRLFLSDHFGVEAEVQFY